VLSEVEAICGRVAIMRAGRLVHEQSMRDVRRGHMIRARLSGRFDGVPESLLGRVRVVADTTAAGTEQLVLEAAESLAPLLGWLATLPLAEVEVEPIGLAAVYDRFHRGAVEC
jgi:ABC-2 type transport system ATP-binding protein